MINLIKNLRQNKKSFFSYHAIGAPTWTSDKYTEISQAGFQKNIIAYRAINLISKGISSIPIKIKNSDNKKEHEHLTKMFNNPNQNQSKNSFFEHITNYLLISGNAFIYMDSNNNMHCLRTDRVKINPNKTQTEVDSYLYSVDSKQFIINKNDILHLKFFNPLNDWYGFSPLQAASRAIDQHNAMSNHNLAILQNGGRPSGCLMVKNGGENLSNEQRNQLRSDVKEAYAGSLNAGKMMVLEGSFEWKEMGLSPKDLDFNSGKDNISREIAQAFGVPPVLIGLKCNSTFSSYKEARLHLWEDTILPLAEMMRMEFSSWLSKIFQENIEVTLDLDGILALTSRREILWHKISNASFLSNEEKRKILGITKEQD